jgi:hypothetical protein
VAITPQPKPRHTSTNALPMPVEHPVIKTQRCGMIASDNMKIALFILVFSFESQDYQVAKHNEMKSKYQQHKEN